MCNMYPEDQHLVSLIHNDRIFSEPVSKPEHSLIGHCLILAILHKHWRLKNDDLQHADSIQKTKPTAAQHTRSSDYSEISGQTQELLRHLSRDER